MFLNALSLKGKQMAASFAALAISITAWSQANVSGTLTGNNEPLVGATVTVLNTYRGANTNAIGGFSLGTMPAGNYQLVFSYLGFAQETLDVVVKSEPLLLKVKLKTKAFVSNELIVSATRANKNTPVATSELSKEELSKTNLGQDLPILLNLLPSVVTTSDAGNGIGYTGLRVRGSDASKINVTINGVPINDGESQGVFWVNTPDFASSVQSIQLQRGVGTSTNGSGAFGASLNLATNSISENAYGEINNSFGSFASRKHTLAFGSGLVNNKFSIEGRLSKIKSDGYVDRASSDLQSYYLQGAYVGKKSVLKALVFGGKENTYQAYYGLDSATLAQSRTRNFAGEIYDANGNVSSTYNNQVDNYAQDHYQLHYSYQISDNLSANAALHYTYGRGYYEEYRQFDDFANYGFNEVVNGLDTIRNTDLVRRRWLDNDFYGTTYSLNYRKNRLQLTFGGAYNIYDGTHFGEVIWARTASQSELGTRFYEGNGLKKDFNTYAKANYDFSAKLNAFADLQIRKIDYSIGGTDNGFVPLDINDKLNFFNPKFGLNYSLNEGNKIYASYAVANREPNRNDYIDAPNGNKPKAEKLQDLELGYRKSGLKYLVELNVFSMNYTNQLVLTGQINDVGAFIRTNSGKSFRNGIELSAAYKPFKWLSLQPTFTFSTNKNENYLVQNSDSTTQNLGNTNISYSPRIIAGNLIEFKPCKGLSLGLMSKYVSEQNLDNLQIQQTTLPAYFVNDVRVNYAFTALGFKNIGINLLINNLFNTKYSSNGYAFDGTAYYFPQAGTNFLLGLNLSF